MFTHSHLNRAIDQSYIHYNTLSIIVKYKLNTKMSRWKRFMRFELKVDGINKLNLYPLCFPNEICLKRNSTSLLPFWNSSQGKSFDYHSWLWLLLNYLFWAKHASNPKNDGGEVNSCLENYILVSLSWSQDVGCTFRCFLPILSRRNDTTQISPDCQVQFEMAASNVEFWASLISRGISSG